jgi:hypothetical protein
VPTSILLWLITHVWESAPGIVRDEGAIQERLGLGLIAMLGALGGYVRWMHWLSRSKWGAGQLSLWLLDSVLTPLKGAALAVPFTLLLRAGIVNPATGEGGGGVNWIGLYGIAALTGLFAPEAVDQLERVFSAIFGVEKTRAMQDVRSEQEESK